MVNEHDEVQPEHVGAHALVAPDETILVAQDMGVAASWGHIYGPVNFSVRRGGVTVIVGHGGRGRTALLLTLAGRMKPTSGSLEAFGIADKPQQLFTRAALGFVDEVDDIEQAIRVHDVITEQVRWAAPWWKWVPQSTQDDYERICRPVFGDLALPHLDSMVEELPELTAALLRIAIANMRKPEVLVVGGIDGLASDTAAHKLLERLVVLGEEQTVITADVNGPTSHLPVRDYIEVPNLTNQEFVELSLAAVGE